jgi:rhamnogalacturonyl hydrolase YesR
MLRTKNQVAHFILFLFLLNSCLGPVSVTAQDTSDASKKLRAIANAVLKNATFQFVDQKNGNKYGSAKEVTPGADLKPESPYNDWRYWNGVLNVGMLKLSEALHDQSYSEFAIKNIAFNFDNYGYFERKYKGEDKWNFPFGQRFIMEELDDCGAMGASVVEVYRLDKQDRYKKYIEQAADHILTKQSRLKDGTFVRSFPHKWTIWADDLYMGLSFLTRMGELTGDTKYIDDAAKQVIQFHKYLFDEKIGLMHHCWYSDVNRPGVAYWGRANGWAVLAQIDLLDRLPENHPWRGTLLALFKKHILGIAHYQGSNGLWHQLLDKTDSYLETSCSAMFTYAVARAVHQGYIDTGYASIAERGWEGIMAKIRPDGQVEGVCTGTVVSDDLDYYYLRPTPLNDVHGLGTILLAGAEVLNK